MKVMKRILGPAVVLLAALLPVVALAQSEHAAPYMTWMLSRYERPPVPPADIPNAGPARGSAGPLRNNASAKRSAPLPRARPGDVAAGVAKQIAPRAQAEPQAEPQALAAGRFDVAPAAVSRPASPAMVPIAPLE